MRSLIKSIAVVAAISVATAPYAAEEAKSAPPQQAPASPVFADSFGLNFAERGAAPRQPVHPAPEQPGAPAADSFGLNNVLVSSMAECQAAKMAKPAGKAHRCIEM